MALVREIIQGNVGRIGELRELNGGNAVLNVSVAVTPRKKEGNEWVDDETIWTEVSLWGDVARNFVNSDIKAGTPVVVIGRRSARRVEAYTTKDGREVPEHVEQSVTADSISVEITRWHVITGIDRANNGGGHQSAPAKKQAAKPAAKKKAPATDDLFAGGSDDIFGGDDTDDIFGDF